MKFMWLRFALLNILNRYWPPEESTAAELRERISGLERENAELKSRLWHPRLVHVEIDQAGQKQVQSQVSSYEPPEKHTDPARLAHLGIRRRAMTRQLQENHQLMHLHSEMLAKKARAITDPETIMLPSMTAPEDDWTNDGADRTKQHKAVNQ